MKDNPLANFSSEVGKAHGPNWLNWLGHLKGKPNVSGLELGTWKGESAEWQLENIFTHETSRYYCVDTFQGSDEHQLAGIDCSGLEQEARARLDRFENRAVICKGYSVSWLKIFNDARSGAVYDFIYVDAAHDAMNVLRDAVFAFEILRVGGVMIFDDYEWTAMHDEVDRPKMAIDSFLNCYARRIEVIGMGWQVAILKTS